MRYAAIGIALALVAVQAFAQLSPPLVKPTAGPWDSGAGFQFDLKKKKAHKTRQSLSGLACTRDAKQQRICLMVFDEGAQARYAHVGENSLVIDPEPLLFSAIGGELDAEAAATDGHYFYVTGSHSAKRSDCSSNPDSRHVIRFRLDPATGRALRSPPGAAQAALVDYADSGRLWQIMQSQPELQAHVGERQCLGSGQQGVNIEGLAIQAGRLYFGFRGPAIQGAANVLAVDADAFFDSGAPQATVTRIALGERRGIRDMVAVKTGVLLLAGPDDDAASQGVGWTVSLWDGKYSPNVVQPKLLATLDISGVKLRKCDVQTKPEALTVLEETPQAYKLLVLSDGMCDGGPLVFTIPR
ncbi:DUF3616 domain-containing protein [Rhodoferax ferrireducens]|uniref:DUF3616 domain-containing protein n=1 Tax=Rhodoferax ferrireducens TaxID=192843 RepID=UPI000E0D9DA8|nr:DUF3616 domain-containing protein [Rhodoferax ferrireducens]